MTTTNSADPFDGDIEAEMAELRASSPRPTEVQYRDWAEQACSSIVTTISGSRMIEGEAEESSWFYTVADSTGSIIVSFREDTWTTADGRIHNWNSVLEGGPDEVGRSIAYYYLRWQQQRVENQ